MKNKFDLSAYLVLGPENCPGVNPLSIIRQAVEGGFTFLQVRSKEASAKEIIQLTVDTARLLKVMGRADEVSLVVDDRLDVILAAREAGAKVDGIHVGQKDIPVEVCRKYLGPESIIGLSSPTSELIDYVQKADISKIDYFGAGPLHETVSKPDCGLDEQGDIITRTLEELETLARVSPLPLVVGGGVKEDDLKGLAATGVDGFFVISAISQANDPGKMARKMVDIWNNSKRDQ